MNPKSQVLSICAAWLILAGPAWAAGGYHDTITLFKNAGESAAFFDKSYAYAVFPTVGEGALGVGGARGKGHVYVHGKWVGDVTMTQVSVGIQAGGRADIVTLDLAHPSLAGRRGDAVLDGWIFAAGADALDCVWAGGDKVVEGGRHRLRGRARDAFNITVRRLVA